MTIMDDVEYFIKSHITVSGSFYRLYLPAWCLASWLVLPGLPVLYVVGPAREQMLRVLHCLCSDINVRTESHRRALMPTLVLTRPFWPVDFYTVRAKKARLEPRVDLDLRFRTALWARRNAWKVQHQFWELLNGQKADPLAALTAVLLVASEEMEKEGQRRGVAEVSGEGAKVECIGGMR